MSTTNRYRFRIAAKNKYGWGEYSDVLEVLAAVVPGPPTGVTSTHNGLYSTIAWELPSENGSAVEGYQIVLQGANGLEESLTCLGDVIAWGSGLRECSVAYTELRSATFDLVLGDTVVAQVKARNEIGFGDYSSLTEVGLTDIVRTEPLQPPTLVTEGAATDSTQIEVEWAALSGDDAGQDAITEYRVFWDNGSSGTNWLLLVSETEGSFTYSYTHGQGITRGDSYQFKYMAANEHGEGPFSLTSTIEASKRPDALSALVVTTQGTDVIVAWSPTPDDHGAEVTDYTVTFRQQDNVFSAVAQC